jgi:hypothetical protein
VRNESISIVADLLELTRTLKTPATASPRSQINSRPELGVEAEPRTDGDSNVTDLDFPRGRARSGIVRPSSFARCG